MTKRKREQVYRKAAETIFLANERGEAMLCWIPLRDITGNSFSYYKFPELILVDSNKISESWDYFDSARILGLLFCAEMCKPKTKRR